MAEIKGSIPVLKPKRRRLPQDAYRALEDIVGAENITQDPAILEGYHNYTTGQVLGIGTTISPPAVILPGSSEEVQAIVRVLGRYHLKCCPISTNFGAPPLWGGITTKDMIYMDLRRMNRILEIDEKNMHIVVEPYVTAAQINGELHKLGLNGHCTGAGPTISPLASTTQGWGMGFDSIFMGWSGRNFLGGEWVAPNGEIIRIGAPGWYYGDSPGPSFWGMLRGGTGALGGLGIFTKCSIKVYPWAGQGEEKAGLPPEIKVVKPPERLYSNLINFPSMQEMNEALYMINKAQIGYALDKIPALALVFAVTPSNCEAYTLLETGLPDIFLPPKVNMIISLGAFSTGEIEYQKKVLMKIVEESGGELFDDLMEVIHAESIPYLHHAWNCYTAQGVFKPCGTFYVGVSFIDTTEACSDGSLLVGEIKKEYEDRGLLLQEGGESNWAAYYEGGTLGGLHTETIWQGDPSSLESMLGANDIFFTALKPWLDRGLTPYWGMHGGPIGALLGGPVAVGYDYRCEIKKAFDPKNIFGNMLYAIVREDD